MRIPDELIEQLKQEVSVERLAEARGITLRRHGADLIGLCPFHDDKEPSLVITPKKNLWHCLGACSTGGSVIDWVMKAEGVSFRHAVELLRAGIPTSTSDRPAPKHATVRKLGTPFDSSVEDRELLDKVVTFYQQTLKESPDARTYLERRRIAHPEAVERFRLGYSNRTLGYRLPHKNRAAGAEIRGRLERLGIYRTSGHEHFSGSLLIPVVNEGFVKEIYGRKIRDDLRTGTPLHLYLPGPHQGVWNLEALQASEEIIVCESLIDALSFWCAGFRHTTASYGIEGFTKDHLDAMRTHNVSRVLITYDNDHAGNRAAIKLAEELTTKGIECFRITFPAGRDANDVACDSKNPTDALGQLIRSATWMGKGSGPRRRQVEPVVSPIDEFNRDPEHSAVSPLVAEPLVAEEQPAELVSPTPRAPEELDPQLKGDELRLNLGDRRWRVRGLSKVSSFDLLRLNVLVAHNDQAGDRFHVDTFDLYSARARAVFTKQAADELGIGEEVIKVDLGRVLLSCEQVADQVVRQAQAPKETAVELSEQERAAALDLLQSPDLVDLITKDFERIGIVGEETNCLVGYLAAISRKLDNPLAVMIQSTSAAGKSALQEAVLSLVPPEEAVRFSAMTGQSLFYMGEADLTHKVLAVAEEEGASRAAYALKLLQSEGELSIASTGKDPVTGRLITHTYNVRGPAAILLTTTAIDIEEELLNRFLVLAVNEDRDQTKAIHHRQRREQTLDGVLSSQDRDEVVELHRNAQRLLVPVRVVNPYAKSLSFSDQRTRTRRDHLKYLTLIRSIALLHQHQREKKTAMHNGRLLSYIEATRSDVELANRLAAEVLGRSLDELPPGTRRLLDQLDTYVEANAKRKGIDRSMLRFTRRELREALRLGDTQLKVHLARLVDLELVFAHRAERGTGFVYELCWSGEGKDGERFVIGLTDPKALTYDPERSGQNDDRSAPGREVVGVRSAPGRDDAGESNPQHNGHKPDSRGTNATKTTDPADSETNVVRAGQRRAG